MNGFDVHAIGWVVTRDACADIARSVLGARRQVAVDALPSLGVRWLAVRRGQRVARPGALRSLGTALPPKSEKVVNEFVLHMIWCCPQLYSEPVLRGRCLSAAAQAFVGFVGGTTAAFFTTPERVFVGDVAMIMVVMACWFLHSTIQLWRTYRVVKRLNRHRGIATGTTRTVIE